MVFLPSESNSLPDGPSENIFSYLRACDLRSLLCLNKQLYNMWFQKRCRDRFNLSIFHNRLPETNTVKKNRGNVLSWTNREDRSALGVLNLAQVASSGWRGDSYMLACAVNSLLKTNSASFFTIEFSNSGWKPVQTLTRIGQFVSSLTLNGDIINAAGLPQVVDACPSLKHLNLTNLSILSPVPPTTQTPKSPCTSLTIYAGTQTYAGLHSLLILFIQIKNFSIQRCSYRKEKDYKWNCSKFSFKSINVKECIFSFDDLITKLLERVDILTITRCPDLSKETFIKTLEGKVSVLKMGISESVRIFGISESKNPDLDKAVTATAIAALRGNIPSITIYNSISRFRATFTPDNELSQAPIDDEAITNTGALCQWVLNNRQDLTELEIFNTEEQETNWSIHEQSGLRCLSLSDPTPQLIKTIFLSKTLQELYVTRAQCPNPFSRIGTYTSPLIHLHFHHCPLLNDEAIVALLKKVVFPHLRSIHISHCPNITGRGWIQQARGGPMGINVSAFGCLNIPTGNLPLLGQHTYPVFGATPPIDPAQPQPEPRRPSLITRVTHVGKSVIMGLKISIFYVARFASRIWSGVSRIWIWR